MLEALGQYHHENPLPLLEVPKKKPIKKLKLNLTHQGDLDIEAEEVSEDNQKELANLLLLVNADNLMRQRAIKQITNDSSEVFQHLAFISLVCGIALTILYFVNNLHKSAEQIKIPMTSTINSIKL